MGGEGSQSQLSRIYSEVSSAFELGRWFSTENGVIVRTFPTGQYEAHSKDYGFFGRYDREKKRPRITSLVIRAVPVSIMEAEEEYEILSEAFREKAQELFPGEVVFPRPEIGFFLSPGKSPEAYYVAFRGNSGRAELAFAPPPGIDLGVEVIAKLVDTIEGKYHEILEGER